MKVGLQILVLMIAVILSFLAGKWCGKELWPQSFEDRYDLMVRVMAGMGSVEQEAALIKLREQSEVWNARSDKLQGVLEDVRRRKERAEAPNPKQ